MPLRRLSSADTKRLLAHRWPGNIRELETCLLRFLVDGSIQLTAHNGDEIRPGSETARTKLKNRLRSEKAQAIQEALVDANFDKELAASILGVSRAQLYRELARYRLEDALRKRGRSKQS